MTQEKEQILLEIIQIYEKVSEVKSDLFSYVMNSKQRRTTDYFEVIRNLEQMIDKRKKLLAEENEEVFNGTLEIR